MTAEYWDETTTEISKTQIHIWAAWEKYYRENKIHPPKEEKFTKTEYPPKSSLLPDKQENSEI